MLRRTIWQIDMGDGTWAVCCLACRLPLYRGAKLAAATRVFRNHLCEPVIPSAAPAAASADQPRWAARARTRCMDGRAAHRQPRGAPL
jgi:hypothetical protein